MLSSHLYSLIVTVKDRSENYTGVKAVEEGAPRFHDLSEGGPDFDNLLWGHSDFAKY